MEADPAHNAIRVPSRYWMVLAQIAVIDIVFSPNSVIMAVGMASHVPVMVVAIGLAVGVMMLAAKSIGDFVDAHPSIKMLVLSFLILVGVALIAGSTRCAVLSAMRRVLRRDRRRDPYLSLILAARAPDGRSADAARTGRARAARSSARASDILCGKQSHNPGNGRPRSAFLGRGRPWQGWMRR